MTYRTDGRFSPPLFRSDQPLALPCSHYLGTQRVSSDLRARERSLESGPLRLFPAPRFMVRSGGW